jgi:GMP synthase (glutamine-hydrolysing)
LLRKDEGKKVMENYGEHFHMNIKMIDAKERFLKIKRHLRSRRKT